MDRAAQRWILGLMYIITIAAIWITASYITQSVVDAGVSPFLVTYICNSLFMVYIPLVEIGHHFNDSSKCIWSQIENNADMQQVKLIREMDHNSETNVLLSHNGDSNTPASVFKQLASTVTTEGLSEQGGGEGQWTRTRVAKVSFADLSVLVFGTARF